MVKYIVVFMTLIALLASFEMTERDTQIEALEARQDSLLREQKNLQYELNTEQYKIFLMNTIYK